MAEQRPRPFVYSWPHSWLARPARYLIAILLLAGIATLAGCGMAGGPTPTPVPVAHPTDAGEAIIRLSARGGGMVASPIYNVTISFPEFALYGDGTALYRTQTGYHQIHLDDAAIERLLRVAVDDAQFFTLPDSLGPSCCDMPFSDIEVHAAGQNRTVTFSLLEDLATPGADSPERRLTRLINAITALSPEDGPAYQPAGVTLYADGGTPLGDVTVPAWPNGNVSLAQALAATRQPGGGWTGKGLPLTGADALAALKAAPIVTQFAQDGLLYYVVAVPDMPEGR